MFGNFLDQFGLNFQLPDANAQGGLFGPDATQPGQPPLGGPAAPGGAGTGLNMNTPAAPPPAPPGAVTPPKMTDPGQAGLPQQGQQPAPSPLASPLAPGSGSGFGQPLSQPYPDTAPAAGVGSQFTNGKASL